jgi:transposase-like protein
MSYSGSFTSANIFPGVQMTLSPVCCPQCSNTQVVKRGKTSNDKQRYLCQTEACPQQTFVLEYRHRGRLPQVKQQIIEMALNGSGIRDTARVLGISKDTVLSEFKKRKGLSNRSIRRCSGA